MEKSGATRNVQNGQDEDNNDCFNSPTNEGNDMLYCQPIDDNVTKSPALGTSLVAKFNLAVPTLPYQNPPIAENPVQLSDIPTPSDSVLREASLKGNGASNKATTETDEKKTPLKTSGLTTSIPSPHERNLAPTFQQPEVRFQDGYDSDGELGSFSFVVEIEGKQSFDEDALIPWMDQTCSVPLTPGPYDVAEKDTFLMANALTNTEINLGAGS
jgi:hypothetical protein